MLAVLAAQPVGLSPLDAVAQTFRDLGQQLDTETRDLVLEQARIARDSPALQAWMASAWLRDERLVAEVLAQRLGTGPTTPGPGWSLPWRWPRCGPGWSGGCGGGRASRDLFAERCASSLRRARERSDRRGMASGASAPRDRPGGHDGQRSGAESVVGVGPSSRG